MKRQPYPSDSTDAQWALLERLAEELGGRAAYGRHRGDVVGPVGPEDAARVELPQRREAAGGPLLLHPVGERPAPQLEARQQGKDLGAPGISPGGTLRGRSRCGIARETGTGRRPAGDSGDPYAMRSMSAADSRAEWPSGGTSGHSLSGPKAPAVSPPDR